MKWINANERTPDDLKSVPLKINGEFSIGHYSSKKPGFCGFGGWLSFKNNEILWLDESESTSPEPLVEALKGHELPQLFRISWLGSLLRLCKKQPVYDSIVKESDGDFDATNTMLNELNEMERLCRDALASYSVSGDEQGQYAIWTEIESRLFEIEFQLKKDPHGAVVKRNQLFSEYHITKK